MSHHPPRIQNPALYVATLAAPASARLLLAMIAEVCVRGRRFRPSQARLGELLHLSPRQVIRHSQLLQARGWIRVIRRGRRLTNVYRLARALWARLMGRKVYPYPAPTARPLQPILAGVGRGVRGWEVYRDPPGAPLAHALVPTVRRRVV